MKEIFQDLRLSKANIEKLDKVNSVIEEYQDQGFRLTLRQLYYQLVSKTMIPNLPSEYAKLSSLIVKGRMAGVIDWDAIEDRTRIPWIPYCVLGVEDAINDTILTYRLNRQKNQDVYIEIMIEKDALRGIIEKITSHYHIRLLVNRGYCSCSAMYRTFKRMQRQKILGKKIYILYLGDYDPSGLHMPLDIGARLRDFGLYPEIIQIGLTHQQIVDFHLPPNPAKITDPRAKWFIKEYGDLSWEVDALKPQFLLDLVKSSIKELIDIDLFKKTIKKEHADKRELRKITNQFKEKKTEKDTKIEIGDIVKLKSGSSVMKVVSIQEEIALCRWFSDDEPQERDFGIEMLELVHKKS